jgi:OOP family OmpA-OmpF porin
MKKISIVMLSFIILTGCTSIEKAKLSSSNPSVVIENIEQEKNSLIYKNTDLLAQTSFKEADKRLIKAKQDLKNNEPTKEILSTLGESKAYFQKAKEMAKSRKILPENILTARHNAVKNQIYTSAVLTKKLNSIDKSLINESDTFRVNLSPATLSNFQKMYQELEIETIQNNRLGTFKRMIKQAERKNAKELAPRTLKAAQNAVNYSENLISQSVLDPNYYRISVVKANKSVKLLNDVMNKLTNDAKGSSEKTALKLVYQERKLGRLSDNITFLQSSLSRSSDQIGVMNEDIKEKDNQIASSKSKLNLQIAIDKVRNSFNEDEANVYQQGNNLIIRLRKINFASGSANIPVNSMSLLSKVNSIITGLHPKEVVIQGHTDSTGYASRNMMLSNKRAQSVKKYLSSLDAKYLMDARGYGESMPIANNQTQMGRILNRRVDIVVKGVQQ